MIFWDYLIIEESGAHKYSSVFKTVDTKSIFVL